MTKAVLENDDLGGGEEVELTVRERQVAEHEQVQGPGGSEQGRSPGVGAGMEGCLEWVAFLR